MRKLITRLVLPLSIILFALFTKWWYVFVVDIGNEIMYGFPFIYKCHGWHTSLSTQYFILEFAADFIFYFITCLSIMYGVRKWIKFRIARTVSLLLWVIASLLLTYSQIEILLPDNRYYISRDFEVEVLETGFNGFFQNSKEPDEAK